MRLRLPLISAFFALVPATALAQDPAKPAEGAAPAPADKPAEAAPAEPAPAPAAEPAEPAPAPAPAAEAGAAATVDMNAQAATGDATAATADTAAAAPAPRITTRGGPEEEGGSDEWKFDYHGYFRAPMRLGMGKRRTVPDVEIEGASDTVLHVPVIPDDQYLSFQSSPHNKKDWAEMFLTIGNSWASGTLSIQGYNFAEAAWNDVDTQFGISQGFVTITPDLGYENFRLNLKAGAMSDKYGQAGRWDAGEYDTYIIGRTHNAGYTLHVDYDLSEAWTLYVEQGLGTKRPDPSHFNNARFTMLNHVHAGLRSGRDLEFGAHYMVAWTQEDDRDFENPSATTFATTRIGLPDGKVWVAGVEARAELGAFGYIYGAFAHIGAEYAVSVAPAIEVLHAQGGGQFNLGVTDNYLDSPNCAGATRAGTPPTDPMGTGVPAGQWGVGDSACSDGNGSINAISAQYEFSLTNFLQQSQGGQRFWGDGEDLRIILYGIYAMVQSDAVDTTTDAPVTGATPPQSYEVNKFKFGTDVTWSALSWLAPAVRFDRIDPNSNIPEQAFMILSPRLTFRSKWLTREAISLQYSRYIYDRRECYTSANPNPDTGMGDPLPFRCVQPPPAPVQYEGFGSGWQRQEAGNRSVGPQTPATGRGVVLPDVNVFKIEASMWW